MATVTAESVYLRSLRRVWFEMKLSFQFNANDGLEYMFPMTVCTLGAWLNINEPDRPLLLLLFVNTALAWLALYSHTLSNQSSGMAEDLINKPYRPIPRGLVTVRGANVRFVAVSFLFLSLSLLWGVLWAAISALGWVVLHNYLGWHRNWFGRQVFNVAVTFTSYAMAWRLAGPVGEVGWRWISVLAAAQTVIFLQDLRDVDGDAETQRRTVPLVIGDWPTRILGAGMLLGLAVFASWMLPIDRFMADLGPWWAAGYGVGCALIAAHFLVYRGPSDDDRAYRAYQLFGHGWPILGLFLMS
ncbi:UbiA family prenyltransferase [Lentzea alba]|uniref:UbiA family prenyltransferase n=1 Tax=Lentzea alba TaxID=2714351 RepID=UPI0039BF3254